MIIRNLTQLAAKGNSEGRKIVLDIIEYALEQVNSYNLIRGLIRYDKDLRIGELTYDLRTVKDIFVVGGGKQVTFVASALESILGDRIREGVVVEKKGWGCKTKRIKVVEGGHPLPDSGSVEGAEQIIAIAEQADADDVVIACVTGGCTSLTTLPPEEITLQETREVCKLLLESGAPVDDTNTVRKHLSRLGGGKLSVIADPAEIVGLIAVDEVAGLPWGPTVPDETTFADAINVLKKYDLWKRAPKAIRHYMEKADPNEETPKASDFELNELRVNNIVFAENGMLCLAAEKSAAELGLRARIISTTLEGEAKDVAVVLASIAREIEKNNRPFQAPCIMIVGGETTVRIVGQHGEGGRNQELALAGALKIEGSGRIVMASIGTDGTDGPTDIAGGIVDGQTASEARKVVGDMFSELKRHNSSHVLRKVGDAIYTRDTATNLMDMIIVYVM